MELTLLNELRESFPNAYKPWVLEDDLELVKLYKEGSSISLLSNLFGRQKGAIERRLEKLSVLGTDKITLTIYSPNPIQKLLLKMVSLCGKKV